MAYRKNRGVTKKKKERKSVAGKRQQKQWGRTDTSHDDIEDQVRKQDGRVSPAAVKHDVERREEFIFNHGTPKSGHTCKLFSQVATQRVLTIAASGRGSRIVEVTTKGTDKVARPVLTRPVRRRVEHVKFVGSAPDNQVVELRRQHRRKCPLRVRYQLVKPRAG